MKKITAAVLSLTAFFALTAGTAFASHDMACCKNPAMHCCGNPAMPCCR
jgi:hypothetical protein